MDRKSKILLAILIALAIISVGFTFYRTVILKDFQVVNTEEGTGNVSL